MIKFRNIAQTVRLVMVLCMLAVASFAQVTTGNVRGTVTDQNGAIVPNAKVTLTQKSTNTVATTQSSGDGAFQFNNLLAADDYVVRVEATNFKTLALSDVKVQLNQTTALSAQLTAGGIGETVTVTAGGAELVDTSTQNLSKSFNDRQVVELAQTTTGLGVYNLALIAPNVSSSGGVGVGSGGSVGGQRARNNNFVVDGIDNNDKGVTGPQVYISPETVQEFTLLSNQYSAEFAHSTGGQFIIATKSGGNDYHGTAYLFGRNRNLNASEASAKNNFRERFDNDRFGGNLSGPLPGIFFRTVDGKSPELRTKSDKVFFFTSYERIQTGAAAGAGGISSPTAAGYTRLAAIPGVRTPILNFVRQFLGTASTNDAGTVSVGGVDIPIGNVTFPAPNFSVNKNFVLNIDWTQSSKTQHRFRFNKNVLGAIDTAASLPSFFTTIPTKSVLFSYTNNHQFTSSVSNELRLAFRRNNQTIGVPNIAFPLAGFDQFPNVTIEELGVSIGPDGNAPQFAIENNYQVIDNVTFVFGNHSLKVGGDFRKLISPQSFVQRQRGDYDYNNLSTLLFDRTPDILAERNVGANTYYGDQKLLFAFGQDDWRIRPNLTLNLGLNYAYQQVPVGAKQQSLNSISSVPGFISFGSPKAQKKNFAPRVGFAYSPNFSNSMLGRLFGAQGTTSIRAGFSMAYDVIFDNIYILSSPPQSQQTVDCPGADFRCASDTGFLTGGGIRNVVGPTGTDAAAARSVTTSFIPDQKVPYAISYTGSIQRQFRKDWSIEVRYLGTRGVHLLTQNRINRQNRITATDFVPTFLSAPSAAQLASLPSYGTIRGRNPSFVPAYSAAGFGTASLVGFLSNGNSTYHAGSAVLTHRFTQGFQMSAAYTWSHLIDDTTAEVFATVLSPRRVQDFQNLRADRADSALDRRQRFVVSSLYSLPFFNKSSNHLVRTILGGINFAGTLAFESGEKAVVRSGIDSNQNGDAAGDRTIINTAGGRDTFSKVCAIGLNAQCILINPANGELCPGGICPVGVTGIITNSPGTTSARNGTFGYLALTPTAQYIQAGLGAKATAGRNTLQLPGIRNLDFSVFKNFRVTEGKVIQFRVDMFNALNHPQFTPGSVNGAEATSITQGNAGNINNIQGGAAVFNQASSVYTSHPRVVQMALRFNF